MDLETYEAEGIYEEKNWLRAHGAAKQKIHPK